MSPLINRMRVIELLTLILPSKLEIRVGGCFEKCLKNLVILSPCHPYYYPYLTHFPLLCGYIGQILWSQRDRYKRVPLYHVTKYHDVNSAKHKELISLSLSLSIYIYIYIWECSFEEEVALEPISCYCTVDSAYSDTPPPGSGLQWHVRTA